jgi:hypothetical protein
MIDLALRAPRLGPCTQPRTGRFRWLIGVAHGPSGVEGSQKGSLGDFVPKQ